MQTVRLWDRKTGACRHILQLPSRPSALHLLSDELTVVTCMISCSVWKGSRCLRSMCPDLSVPARVTNSSRICASAVSDNLLFLVFDGECAWVLMCSLSPLLSQIVLDNPRGQAFSALQSTQQHLLKQQRSQTKCLLQGEGIVPCIVCMTKPLVLEASVCDTCKATNTYLAQHAQALCTAAMLISTLCKHLDNTSVE